MSRYSHIQRGFDLSDQDFADAVESRDTTKELLDRLAEVSEVNAGAAKVLMLFARLATTDCEWIDGELRVELVPAGEMTVFEVMTDLGGGMRERLFAPTALRVPLDEFRRSVERLPQLIEPLIPRMQPGGRMVLTASADARRSTNPPPAVTISEESMYGALMPTADRARGRAPALDLEAPRARTFAVAARTGASNTTPAPLRGLAAPTPPLAPALDGQPLDVPPNAPHNAAHNPTARGMPAAPAAPLPSDAPPSARGFTVPAPMAALRGLDPSLLEGSPLGADPWPEPRPDPRRFETRPGFRSVQAPPMRSQTPAPPIAPAAPAAPRSPPVADPSDPSEFELELELAPPSPPPRAQRPPTPPPREALPVVRPRQAMPVAPWPPAAARVASPQPVAPHAAAKPPAAADADPISFPLPLIEGAPREPRPADNFDFFDELPAATSEPFPELPRAEVSALHGFDEPLPLPPPLDAPSSEPRLPTVGDRAAAPPPRRAALFPSTDPRVNRASPPPSAARVTSDKDLFDDQDAELELDWGDSPPKPR